MIVYVWSVILRKQQKKLLIKAKKLNMNVAQIDILAREDLTIYELQTVMDYFKYQPKEMNKDFLASETKKYIEFLKEKKGKIGNINNYKILFSSFMPSYFTLININKDILLGTRKKFRIYKMYMFFIKHMMNREITDDNFFKYIFINYVFMLYMNFSIWHTNTVLRSIFSNKDKEVRYRLIFKIYPCIMDDFLYNGRNSIFYYIAIETNIIEQFESDPKVLEELYNYDCHHFPFKKEEFHDYFIYSDNNMRYSYGYVLNEPYFREKQLKQYPIVGLIGDFCKKSILEPCDKENGIFTTWNICRLMEPKVENKIRECYKILGQGFSTDAATFYFSVSININGFVTVKYCEYKAIKISESYDAGWDVIYPAAKKISFVVSPDGKLYRKSVKSGKYYPIGMKDFIYLYKNPNLKSLEFMDLILDYNIQKNVFYREVVCDYMETKATMPLNFNEIADYHNRADLILKKYKTASYMNIKWNKQNLNLSYLLIKAYNIVDPYKSRQILLQQKKLSPVTNGVYSGKACNRPYEYVKQLLLKRILDSETRRISKKDRENIEKKYRAEIIGEIHTDILSDEYNQWINKKIERELGLNGHSISRTIDDYISMCRQAKIKIRLDICSVKQLDRLHERIGSYGADYREITKDVVVPDKSKFLPLREILPEEFEWITTRKRLILETELQNHCVWSYAEKITDDVCAIYSFTDKRAEYGKDGKPKRYTIEFRIKNGVYYVEQVQGKNNKVNADGMREYIQSLLVQYIKKSS